MQSGSGRGRRANPALPDQLGPCCRVERVPRNAVLPAFVRGPVPSGLVFSACSAMLDTRLPGCAGASSVAPTGAAAPDSQSVADCVAPSSFLTFVPPSRDGADEGRRRLPPLLRSSGLGAIAAAFPQGGRSTREGNFIWKPQLTVAADTLNETRITGVFPPSTEARGSSSLCATTRRPNE
jgi:hypothetical protein